ncbi:MAG: OmpH family outer membrane protein [Pseudomonadota bacterium]
MGGAAQAAAEYKIGFVDTERILREAAPAVKAMKELEAEFAPKDQDLKKMSDQAKALQAELEKENMTMADSERRAKEQKLAQINRDFQRIQREAREDLNMRRNEKLATLLERVNKVIKGIAESEQYDLILQDAVYKSGRIDITEKVLKALADK